MQHLTRSPGFARMASAGGIGRGHSPFGARAVGPAGAVEGGGKGTGTHFSTKRSIYNVGSVGGIFRPRMRQMRMYVCAIPHTLSL